MSLREFNEREAFLATANCRGTGIVPCRVGINGAVYDADAAFYEAVKAQAPDVEVSAWRRATERTWRDAWGCLWQYPGGDLDGQVIEHPLADWAALEDFKAPDPARHTDWAAAANSATQARKAGRVVAGNTEHGVLFLRLEYLRGFDNFMIDLAEDRRELYELRDRVMDYWSAVVQRWLDIGVDYVSFADDLGHQRSLPISPIKWRSFFKPAFARLFGLCRDAGVEVYLHSDGYIVDIIPDLIDIGVSIINPQDLVNGLDNIERLARGKTCVDLDIDRQSVTAFGRPEQIDEHVRNCIAMLGSPAGGLMLLYGGYAGTPRENIAQVILSMQKHHRMWCR